jgi:hypothetical protein
MTSMAKLKKKNYQNISFNKKNLGKQNNRKGLVICAKETRLAHLAQQKESCACGLCKARTVT